MIGYGNSVFLRTALFSGGGGGGLDPDAQAFITAAAITDPTQQAAINTLVVDLKGYNVWTKMKALYPMVGGTASQHKFNLKNPLDTDAAFRLVFSGGWTHSSNGATPNGTNAYADTFLNPSTSLTTASAHFSKYNRTNDLVGNKVDGIFDANNNSFFQQNYSAGNGIIGSIGSLASYTPTDTRGLFTATRTSTNAFKVFKNSSSVATNTTTITNIANFKFFIGARNDGATGGQAFYNSYQCAFASIGDGLTDTEAANLYTAVQAFQTALGRSIGTQTVSDADAQAFVTNAGIVDQVEANAINNLVIGMKADGLWTKMKAVYPFVGGTATTHKFNLKNPLDTDAAFRLVFNGGWTHSANGAQPNGTNGFANTYFAPNTGTLNSNSIGYYIRTVNSSGATDPVNMGGFDSSSSASSLLNSASTVSGRLNGTVISGSITGGTGLISISKTSSTVTNVYKNGTSVGSGNSGGTLASSVIYLGTTNILGVTYASGYVNSQFALVYISDGLSGVEAANLYTAVQAFQTTLGRNV
jgi:hypothetical protein